MFNEYKISLNRITSNISIGCNSFVSSLTPNFHINSWCYDETNKNIIIKYKHIPSKPIINATIRITDNNDKKCYDTVNVFIPQATSIWCTEGMYIERDVCYKCCDEENRIIPRQLENIEINISTVDGTPWITNIKAFIYQYDFFIVDCSEVKDNTASITLILKKCYDVVNCPIIICGYNDDNELIGQTIVYLTVNHTKNACNDNENSDYCLIQVNPTKITIPFGTYLTYKDLENSSIGAKVTAFAQKNTNLTYNGINENDFKVNSVFSKFYNISKFVTESEFEQTKANEETKTSGKRIEKEIEISLDNCKQTLSIVLQEQTIIDKDIKLINGDSKLNLFFWDSDANHDGHNHPEDDFWKKIYYAEVYTCEFTTDDWYIYQCDSSIIQCIKNGKKLEILLIDYSPISYTEPLSIILKNSYGNIFIIEYAVDEGLVAEDEFSMYWNGYYDKYIGFTEGPSNNVVACINGKSDVTYYEYYSNRYQQPLILHSACSLVFDGNKPRYESWTMNASTQGSRISYTLKQYLKTITINQDTWIIFNDFITCDGVNYNIYNDGAAKKVKINGIEYNIDIDNNFISKVVDGQTIINRIEKPEWREVTVGDMYLRNIDSVTIEDDIFDSRIWINKIPSQDNAKLGDFLIQTNTTFLSEQECYIDFYQTNGGDSIRLNIKHDPILVYRIYTDQSGSVIMGKYNGTDNLDTK